MAINTSSLPSIPVADGNRRRFKRVFVAQKTVARTADSDVQAVQIVDFSAGGCSFSHAGSFIIGDQLSIGLNGAGAIEGTVVRLERDRCSVEFDRDLNPEEAAAAFTGCNVVTLQRVGHVSRGEKFSGVTRLVLLGVLGVGCWLPILALIKALD